MVRMDPALLNMPKAAYSDLFAYSHSKRTQIEITDMFSKKLGSVASEPKSQAPVSFVSMHPGWASTPGLDSAMPSFSKSDDLRSQEQGADSIVWLLDIPTEQNQALDGELVFDREATFKHFTFAGTSVSDATREKMWQDLEHIFEVDANASIERAFAKLPDLSTRPGKPRRESRERDGGAGAASGGGRM